MKRILMVEDHPSIAAAIAMTLRGRQIASTTVATPDQYLPELFDGPVDLALVDIEFGEDRLGGLAVLQDAVKRGVRAAMFTGVTDPARLGACLNLGAVGVLSKSLPFEQVILSAQALLDGDPINSDNQRLDWLMADKRRQSELEPFRSLTNREAAVLAHLMEGRRVDEIAEADFVSVTTVRSQVRTLLRKLDAQSQVQAVSRAAQARWVPPTPV